jgi:isopentenyl-diphosphate delta-isomerase
LKKKTLGDQQTSKRKSDHIELAFQSQLGEQDNRFFYEPMLQAHPSKNLDEISFLGKTMRAPIWVSSMTGGTELAGIINRNLARCCNEFGLGMGLGSCRIILDDDTYLKDFQLREIIGEAAPFFANLGIAQLEELFRNGKSGLITELIKKTETDGLIVHVNPIQEWLQPEGDVILESPLVTVSRVRDVLDVPIIVKEVGQGMGPKSLEALIGIGVDAVDFGAHGGTNFALLELLRAKPEVFEEYGTIASLGHSAMEMVDIWNELNPPKDLMVIVSGGIKNFLDGYYCIEKIKSPAVYGQASAFLKHATEDYEKLRAYTMLQTEGLKLANAYLSIKS